MIALHRLVHFFRRDQRHFFSSLVMLLGGLLISSSILAQTAAYVTDQGDFNLRSGESTRHKIVRILSSGTEVQVLSQNRETGYSRVRLNDGTIGFILTRYLQSEPAARDQLSAIQAQLDELQQAPDQLTARLTTLQEEHKALLKAHQETVDHKDQIEQELIEIRRAAANVVNITQERAALQEDVARLTRKVGELEQNNLELSNLDKQKWVVTGALIAGAGVLIGLILPHLHFRRRRQSWGGSF